MIEFYSDYTVIELRRKVKLTSLLNNKPFNGFKNPVRSGQGELSMMYLQTIAERTFDGRDFSFPSKDQLQKLSPAELESIWQSNNEVFLRLIKTTLIPFFGLSSVSVKKFSAISRSASRMIKLVTFFVKPVMPVLFLAHLYRMCSFVLYQAFGGRFKKPGVIMVFHLSHEEKNKFFSIIKPRLNHTPRCLIKPLPGDQDLDRQLALIIKGRSGRESKYFKIPLWRLTPNNYRMLGRGLVAVNQIKKYAITKRIETERDFLLNRLLLQETLEQVFFRLGVLTNSKAS